MSASVTTPTFLPPDQQIYSHSSVRISQTIASIGGITYPINGIGSILIKRPSYKNPLLLLAIFVVFGMMSATGDSPGLPMAVAIVASIACIVWCVLAQSTLVIRTASGDQQALVSRDRDHLVRIKAAIEQAVQLRG